MDYSGELNRQQRRKSAKVRSHLIKVGTSTEKLALTSLAILEQKMVDYGNVLSGDHRKALLEVVDLYSKIIFGETTGRSVIALDCGLGKTLSVVATLSAIHRLGYDSRSVLVCQSRVSELCLMVDALIQAGVPPEKIGLVHSYVYDPLSPVIDGEVQNLDGTLRQGYAAKPSNAKDDSSEFQFLLCSHQKLRGKKDLFTHTQYKGKARSLNIWDEGLISTEANSVSLRELNSAIVIYENDHLKDLTEVAPFIDWLKSSYSLLAAEEYSQSLGNKPKVINLPKLSIENLGSFEKLSQHRANGRRTEWRRDLRDLLDMSSESVRVSTAGGEVLQYSDAVSKELTNLVVLDASYTIRQLVRLDPTLKELSFFVHRHDLKSYEDVTLHRLNYYGSRDAAENPEKSFKVATEIALVIKEIPVDEAVCLFTFKHVDPKKPAHASGICSALSNHGIDPAATVTLKDGSIKPRFVFKTWGEHTGANNAAYCTHLFMAGVLRQREDKFAAQLIGQSHDLLTEMDSSALREAMISECAHVVYQASLRSRARMVSHGKALKANLYLVFDEPKIEDYLKSAMRGLQVKEWIPKDQFFTGTNVINDVAKKMILAFEDLTQGSTDLISGYEFKKGYGFSEVPTSTYKLSRDQALLSSAAWKLEGRSFKRVFPAVNQ